MNDYVFDKIFVAPNLSFRSVVLWVETDILETKLIDISMLRTKLLLISLFTSLTWLGLQAQTVNVHGTVTNMDGTGQPGVNIMVTAFYADSTVEFESVYTLGDGTYAVEISAPRSIFWVISRFQWWIVRETS